MDVPKTAIRVVLFKDQRIPFGMIQGELPAAQSSVRDSGYFGEARCTSDTQIRCFLDPMAGCGYDRFHPIASYLRVAVERLREAALKTLLCFALGPWHNFALAADCDGSVTYMQYAAMVPSERLDIPLGISARALKRTLKDRNVEYFSPYRRDLGTISEVVDELVISSDYPSETEGSVFEIRDGYLIGITHTLNVRFLSDEMHTPAELAREIVDDYRRLICWRFGQLDEPTTMPQKLVQAILMGERAEITLGGKDDRYAIDVFVTIWTSPNDPESKSRTLFVRQSRDHKLKSD